MKILVVFIDMVRVNQLNLFDVSKPETLLDRKLRKMGGTLFTRCYTPAPDTPRSNACMQTGLYPYFNGCDTRIKWPKYFIKEDITTIFDHANDSGYTINACIRRHTVETGLLKYKDSTKVTFFNDYHDFIENAHISNNCLSFVYDPDWHTAITDYHSTDKAFYEGDRVVSKLFEKYITESYYNQYDYVIIYSDHGFQFRKENDSMRSKLELLDDGRNQILLLIRKKEDTSIIRDNRLASMVDLYATIEKLIGKTDCRHGYSLLEEPRRKILHIEDHQDFRVYPEVMIKQWRIITETYDVRTDAKDYSCGSNAQIIKEIESYLKEYSPKYTEYVKQLTVWKHYSELSNDTSDYYVVGEKRKSKLLLFLHNTIHKLKSILFKKCFSRKTF